MSTIGTTNTLSFVKIREVTLQFLGDLTWNNPFIRLLFVSDELDSLLLHTMNSSCYDNRWLVGVWTMTVIWFIPP